LTCSQSFPQIFNLTRTRLTSSFPDTPPFVQTRRRSSHLRLNSTY